MQPLPSTAPFADLLADLTADLRRGSCCLVTADKGWTPGQNHLPPVYSSLAS